jgi:hypothetical protein
MKRNYKVLLGPCQSVGMEARSHAVASLCLPLGHRFLSFFDAPPGDGLDALLVDGTKVVSTVYLAGPETAARVPGSADPSRARCYSTVGIVRQLLYSESQALHSKRLVEVSLADESCIVYEAAAEDLPVQSGSEELSVERIRR